MASKNPYIFTCLRYAWTGSISLANGLSTLVGAALLYVLNMLTGWKIPLPDGVPGLFVGGVYCFAVMWVVILIARFLGAALHFALEPHRRPLVILRGRLGILMWPIISMAAGIFLFALLCGGGLIWLAFQIRAGGLVAEAKTNETPNTVGNPDFVLSVPRERYRFTWPSQRGMGFYLRLDTERNLDRWQSAAFILRNNTNTVAYRVAVTWKSETLVNLDDEVKNGKLSEAKFFLSETDVTVSPNGPGLPPMGQHYYIEDAPRQVIAVIAKEEEVYLPQALWPTMAIYLTSRIPNDIGQSSAPFIARVVLDWETADGKRHKDYRVQIRATNAKASRSALPIVDAYLDFRVEEIPQ
jgi:hypothetical protein